ncbi:MAG: 50S ribosomal protein L13 [Patescibacteria group bacterium]
MFKSYQPRGNNPKREWHLVDVEGKVLGRVSTDIAQKLMGKNKKTYAPQADEGDYVVVINAGKVRVTGKKEKDKIYYSHSGYPGGLKARSVAQVRATNPTRLIELAVKRMLPKNRLQAKRMARLKIYASDQHPYADKIKNNG